MPGDLSYTWYGRGTSNAAALASRTATRLYDVLDELRQGVGGDIVETVPYAVWLKALLVPQSQLEFHSPGPSKFPSWDNKYINRHSLSFSALWSYSWDR